MTRVYQQHTDWTGYFVILARTTPILAGTGLAERLEIKWLTLALRCVIVVRCIPAGLLEDTPPWRMVLSCVKCVSRQIGYAVIVLFISVFGTAVDFTFIN